jgi:hypothetical protein
MLLRLLRRLVTALLILLMLPAAASAAGFGDPASQWLPSAANASWVYEWTDSSYAPPTRERYTLDATAGNTFRVRWTTSSDDLGNGDSATQSDGFMDFQRTEAGVVNLNWNSTPPPPQMPILCASATSCGNSLAGTYYMMIWGTRSPVLAEPLLAHTEWSSVGGAGNDVGSTNRYLGMQRVFVPAWQTSVPAAVVQSQITQAGALGDPYGSGVRTVWWVYGVGPVKIEFRHASGETGTSQLISTSLTPKTAPPDTNYLPLNRGDRAVFRWTNSKYMPKASTQQFDVSQVVNNSSRVDVKRLSGPIGVTGAYVFATRTSGVTNLAANTQAASRAKFPKLGPSFLPKASRRHIFTPYDLMTYGFNPVLPAYPVKGTTWRSSTKSRDYQVFGVTGVTKVLGTKTIRVRAGRFHALVVQSTLRQKGYSFGSGKRTMWFAPNKGLVKLVFRHADGSVSTVERVR